MAEDLVWKRDELVELGIRRSDVVAVCYCDLSLGAPRCGNRPRRQRSARPRHRRLELARGRGSRRDEGLPFLSRAKNARENPASQKASD